MSKTTEQLISCDHCWHFTGDMLTSIPPQYRSICCWCGELKIIRSQIDVKQDAAEHGHHIENLSIAGRGDFRHPGAVLPDASGFWLRPIC